MSHVNRSLVSFLFFFPPVNYFKFHMKATLGCVCVKGQISSGITLPCRRIPNWIAGITSILIFDLLVIARVNIFRNTATHWIFIIHLPILEEKLLIYSALRNCYFPLSRRIVLNWFAPWLPLIFVFPRIKTVKVTERLFYGKCTYDRQCDISYSVGKSH